MEQIKSKVPSPLARALSDVAEADGKLAEAAESRKLAAEAETRAKWTEIMTHWVKGDFSETAGFSRDLTAERYFAADCALDLTSTALRQRYTGPAGASDWLADKADFDFGRAARRWPARPRTRSTRSCRAAATAWTIRGGMVHAFVATPRGEWAALEAGTASSSADPLAPLKAAEPDEITEEDWAKAVVVGGDRVSAADAHLPLLGQRCTIVGLSGRADLNGRRGTARRWNAAKERLSFARRGRRRPEGDPGAAGQPAAPRGRLAAAGGGRARGGGAGEEVRFVTCPLCASRSPPSEAECGAHADVRGLRREARRPARGRRGLAIFR